MKLYLREHILWGTSWIHWCQCAVFETLGIYMFRGENTRGASTSLSILSNQNIKQIWANKSEPIKIYSFTRSPENRNIIRKTTNSPNPKLSHQTIVWYNQVYPNTLSTDPSKANCQIDGSYQKGAQIPRRSPSCQTWAASRASTSHLDTIKQTTRSWDA